MRSLSTAIIRIQLFSIIFLLFFGVSFCYADSPKRRHVLLLNSYHQNMTWVQNIVQGVRDELQPDMNNLVLHIQNMDSKRFKNPAYIDSLVNFYRTRYENTAFDLILSSDNNAFEFLRNYRDRLFPGVPVVFCGVNNLRNGDLEGFHQVTGVEEVFDAKATLELALDNHPDTKDVFVINDYLLTGVNTREQIEAQLAPFSSRVNLRFSENRSVNDLAAQIAELKPGSIVLLGIFYTDSNGLYSTFERMGRLLTEKSRVPVYCLYKFNIGPGIIGGKVSSGYSQGRSMAIQGRRILQGTSPDNIPVIRSGVNRYIFDAGELRRFGISESDLPPGSQIINRPFSFYREYYDLIWLTAGFILLLIVSIIALLFSIRNRKAIEQQLQDNKDYLHMLIEQSPIGLGLCRMDGSWVSVNPALATIIGYSVEETLALSYWDLTPHEYAEAEQHQLDLLESIGRYGPYEKEYRHKNGALIPVRLNGLLFRQAGETFIWSSVENISEYKAAETEKDRLTDQLRQSQKMEALGTLAGGIAHDFNNILAAILGYAELTLRKQDFDGKSRKNLEHVVAAAKRGRDLIKQILLFSRKNTEEKRYVELHRVITEAVELLKKTVPATISFNLVIDNECAWIKADETQLHQVVMNLCTNAVHAMQDKGGVINISLTPVNFKTAANCPNFRLEAGDYGRLTISDSGMGMDPDVMSRIFDPFFTTKKPGKGTGLGLAVVHGIVKSHGGVIDVQSRVGHGTAISVYLPVTKTCPDNGQRQCEDTSPEKGSEHILWVDDEQMLADLGKEILEPLGYRVTATTSVIKALELFHSRPEDFQIIVSDQTMPEMTGDKFAQEALKIRPDIPVIICTGHSANLDADRAESIGIRALLMKPIDVNSLTHTLRTALES